MLDMNHREAIEVFMIFLAILGVQCKGVSKVIKVH